MTEHRSLTRVKVPQIVSVHDIMRGIEVGTVVNLHEEGFLLIGTEEIKESGVYQLRFEFTNAINGVAQMNLGAECLWSNECDTGLMCWSGFHIIDLAEQDKEIISSLIAEIAE